MKMKIIKMLALGSVLSASLVLAQTSTTSAAGTSTHQTKAQAKAQAKAAKAQAKSAAAAKPAPAKPAAPAAKAAVVPAKTAMAAPAMPAKTTSASAKTTAAKAAPPNGGDIASAKSKGMVWVNLNTKVYHSSSDKEYGTTKNGKFMTESDAKAGGYKLAKR